MSLRSRDYIEGGSAIGLRHHIFPGNHTPVRSVTEVWKFYILQFGPKCFFQEKYGRLHLTTR